MQFQEAFNWMKNGRRITLPSFIGYWEWDAEAKTIIIVTKNNERLDIRESPDMDFTIGFMMANTWDIYRGPDDPREIESKENDPRPIDEETIDSISKTLSVLGLRLGSTSEKTDKKTTAMVTEIIDGVLSGFLEEKLNSTWLQIGQGKKTLEDFHRVQSELERHVSRVHAYKTALAATSDEDGQEDEYKGEEVGGFLSDEDGFFTQEFLEKIIVGLREYEQFKNYTAVELLDLLAQGKIYPKSAGEGDKNERGKTEVSFTIDFLPFTEAQAPVTGESNETGYQFWPSLTSILPSGCLLEQTDNVRRTASMQTASRHTYASSVVDALIGYAGLNISKDYLLEEECRFVTPEGMDAPVDAKFGDLMAMGMNTIVDTDGVQYLPVNFSGDAENFDPRLAHHEFFKDWVVAPGRNLESGFILVRPISNIEPESVTRDGALFEGFFLNAIKTNKEGDKLFYMSPSSKLLQSKTAFNKTTGAFYKDVETNLTAEMVLKRLSAINVYQIVKNSFVDRDETYGCFKQSLSLESLSLFIDEATNRILENFADTCHSAETQFERTRVQRNLDFCVKNLRRKLFETMGDVLNSQETSFPDSASHFFDVFVVRLREFGEITSLRWVEA